MRYYYNDVKLPDINTVWTDKETYPYAFIGIWIDGYYLALTDARAYWEEDKVYVKNANRLYYYCSANEEKSENPYKWEYMLKENSENEIWMGTIIWSSHDILKTDGSLYFAATEPVAELYCINKNTLEDIGNAYREVNGTTDKFKTSTLAERIRGMVGKTTTDAIAEELYQHKRTDYDVEPKDMPAFISELDVVMQDHAPHISGTDLSLPIDNDIIDYSKLYRTPTVSLWACFDKTSIVYPIEALAMIGGYKNLKFYYNVVDKLPTLRVDMANRFSNGVLQIYVVKSTGIAYTCIYDVDEDTELNWMPASRVFAGWMNNPNVFDAGYFDLEEVLNGTVTLQLGGIYTLIQSEKVGIPNADGSREIYEHNGTEWVKLGKGTITEEEKEQIIQEALAEIPNAEEWKIYG